MGLIDQENGGSCLLATHLSRLSARASAFIQERVMVDAAAAGPHDVQSMNLWGEKHLSRLLFLHLGVLLSSTA